jgi:hypothetical protein
MPGVFNSFMQPNNLQNNFAHNYNPQINNPQYNYPQYNYPQYAQYPNQMTNFYGQSQMQAPQQFYGFNGTLNQQNGGVILRTNQSRYPQPTYQQNSTNSLYPRLNLFG